VTAPSLRQQVAQALAAAGCAPLHRFGQNFMIDARARDLLAEELGAAAGVRAVEIGPGTGVLTGHLLALGCAVLAVEIDHGLAAWLERELGPRGLRLVVGDCLASKTRLHPAIEAEAAAGPWRLGANLPYDVALPVVLNAAALPRPPERVVVTVQFEAARRLCSRPGDDAWGASAAVLQAAGRPRLVRKLGPGSFHPAPRVDSAILAWTPERALAPGFGAFCRALFAYRRKVLPAALRDAGWPREQALEACAATGLDPARRAEGLDAPELTALHAVLPARPPADDHP
jgi:16S rRNA (adenine1518-N6/adenine1519-N6)-dimethyltransferase